MKTTGFALVAAVLVIAACGGGDASTAASCAESWNADANASQQATLAGTMAVDAGFEGQFRVGTWPKGEQTVSTRKGFAATDGAKAVVGKGSCLVVLPDSRFGRMAFAESDGKWVFVANPEGKAPFPTAAAKAIAGARAAEPDALGKLTLQ
jgi:hypothetical protein